MNLKCKMFGHDAITRDFYPHDPVTSIACTRCGEILKAYKNPAYFDIIKVEKMVCINNKDTNLTIGKTYEILYTRDGYFYMKDDTGQVKNYINKFITNKEYRKRKLQKLNTIYERRP